MFTACKCYVLLTVDGRNYSTNKASFKDLSWNEEFTIPFTSTSRLNVAIQCAHENGAKDHPIARLVDFDVLKSELLADRTLSLSPVGKKSRLGSITLHFHFGQTRNITQSPNGLKDALNRQRIPAGTYTGMKQLEANITAPANIMPPSWSALVTSLSQIAKAAKSVAEVNSSAQVALAAVSAAIQMVLQQTVRDGKIFYLLEMIASIYDVLRYTDFGKIMSFKKTIQRLLRATTECSYFITDYCNTESLVRRVVDSAVSSVDEIIGEFERRFSQLRVEFLMGSTIQAAQVAFVILEKVTKLEVPLDLNMLPMMEGTSWSEQFGETRGAHADVIDGIVSWVHTDNNHVYLLLGDTQSGKTFIANSISQMFTKEGRLGSSIFFSHSQNDTRRFASTMACELSAINQGIKERIADAISTTPALASASLSRQFNELIIGPLKTLTFIGPIMVVVDGLDHCEDPEAFETFIQHIPNFPPNFRFLLTSRPRPDAIRLLFSLKQYRSRVLTYELATPLEPVIHHAAQQLGEQTLQTFSSSMIDTACEVVVRRAESQPCALLCILHTLSSRPKEQAAAFISQMGLGPAELPPEFEYLSKCPLRSAQEIIATSHEQSYDLLLTFIAQTPAIMGTLWSTFLSPILIPGGAPAPSTFQMIYQQTIHRPSMSYEEFFLSCQVHRHCVGIEDVSGFHTQYMRLLNGLFAADIACTANNTIASTLRCLLEGWVGTVVQIGLGNEELKAVLDELRQVFSTYFIKWVEVMKRLGWVTGKMVNQLETICHWLQGKIQHGDMLPRLAIDGLRFVQLHQRDIAKAPSRILNLIKGISTGTTLYQTYITGDHAPIKGDGSQWPRLTFTLEDVPNLGEQQITVCGVAYSPDGKLIVAIQGMSVGVWDARSGTLIRERAGMGNPLRELVLSPDSTKVLARDDKTLYRWELDGTSPPERLPVGETPLGIAHGYSSDGQIFFSSNSGQKLQIQINGDQHEFPALKDICSAAISPDKKLVAASCDANNTIFIFDIQTMHQVVAIRPYSGMAELKWSPCCAFLVGLDRFQSECSAVYLWDSTGEPLSRINTKGSCYQFSISPDSTKLILASDFCIEIWNISNTSKPSRLELIPEAAFSVAFSPDGRRFVVGADPPEQPSIRVYDIEPIWNPQPTRRG